jgi:FkbM family methyltransferase
VDRLPPVIEEFARTHPDAFFIQIGSNDGEQLDPLRRAILERRWAGVMVEPVPYVFERLRRNYGGQPGVTLEKAAIADQDGVRELYHLAQTSDPGLPQWYDALGSFRKEIVMKHAEFIPDIENRVRTLKVPCLTFDSLCRKYGISRVDVIQMDTEGYDDEILKMIDFQRYRPLLVMFEHLHLEAPAHRECLEHLAQYGYQALHNGMDTLCLRVADLTWRDWRMRYLWQRLSKLESEFA